MVEVVTQIKAAEAQADEIRKTARQRARQQKEQADAAGRQLVEERLRKANDTAADILRQARSEADAHLETEAEKTAQECAGIAAHAQASLGQAAAAVVERIVERL